MFPLELLTLLGSGVMGFVMTYWGMKLKAQQQQQELMIRGLTAKSKVVDKARRYENKGFQFTRRIIALSAVFAILVLPKLAAVFMPEITTTVGYTEFRPGFLFFTEGRDVVQWVTQQGLTLTPLDTHTVSAIIGLYFGSSITRNA